MLYNDQLKLLIFIIPIGDFKKFVPNFFCKENNEFHYEILQLYLS